MKLFVSVMIVKFLCEVIDEHDSDYIPHNYLVTFLGTFIIVQVVFFAIDSVS